MRLFFAAAFALYLSSFSMQARATSIPGVNLDDLMGGLWGIMEDRGLAMRTMDRAMASAIVMPNDSALALTCFDRALVASSRLGRLFSDVPPEKIMPPTREVFNGGVLYNVYAGIGLNNMGHPNMLVNAYASLANSIEASLGGGGAKALPPPYDQVQGLAAPTSSFARTMTGMMGATDVVALPLYANAIYEALLTTPSPAGLYHSILAEEFENPLISLFDTTAVGDLAELMAGALFVSHAAWKQFQVLMPPIMSPPDALREGIGVFYAALEEVIDYRTLFFQTANGPGMLADSYVAALVNLSNDILGLGVVSLTGKSWPAYLDGGVPPPNLGCPYLKYLFTGIPETGLGLRGLTGSGPTRGVPYQTYSQMVGITAPYTGRRMLDQLDAPSPIMDRARNTSVDLMSAPKALNGLLTWKPTPPIPPDISVTGVVTFMP